MTAAQEDGDPFAVIDGPLCLCDVYFAAGEYAEAARACEEGYNAAAAGFEGDAAEKPEFAQAASVASQQLAAVHAKLLNYDAAIEWSARAESFLESSGMDDYEFLSLILTTRGAIHEAAGDNRAALGCHLRALEIITAHPHVESNRSTILNNIGLLFFSQGNLEKAREYLNEAVVIDRGAGAPDLLAVSLNNYCLLLESGDMDNEDKYTAALECRREALSISGQAGDNQAAGIALDNLGALYLAHGDYEQARAVFVPLTSEAADIRVRAAALHNLAAADFFLGRLDAALDSVDRAISLKQEYAQLDFVSLALKAAIFHKLGRLPEARSLYDAAINNIERKLLFAAGGPEDYSLYFSRMAPVYGKMILLLIEMNDLDGAIRYYDRMRSNTLKEILRRGQVRPEEFMPPELRARSAALKAALDTAAGEHTRLSNLYAAARQDKKVEIKTLLGDALVKLDAAESAYGSLLDSFMKSNPEAAVKTGGIEPAGIEALQRSLAPGQAAVAFLIIDNSILIFIVSHDSAAYRVLDDAYTPLSLQIKHLARWKMDPGVSDPQTRSYERAMGEISDMLIAPIEKDIEGYERLFILPDGALWDVPFAALTIGGAYVVEKHELSYHISFSGIVNWINRNDAEMNIDRVLAMGDAVYPGECVKECESWNNDECARAFTEALQEKRQCDPGSRVADLGFLDPVARAVRTGRTPLKRIPATAEEVAAIATIFPASEIYTADRATEKNFRAAAPGGADAIHLAAHGVFFPGDPMSSYIALKAVDTSNGEDDGALSAREALRMSLDARIAVLSACETARANAEAGQSFMGLAWAFLAAGSDNVAASLWFVDDRSTMLLMIKFYEEINAGAAPAAALRTAQLNLLHAAPAAASQSTNDTSTQNSPFAAPFYWAPFIIIGP